MSPSLAFGWQVWTRHRLGLTLCAGYWLLLLVLASAWAITSPHFVHFPFLLVWPCPVVFGYLVIVFLVGRDARLEVGASGFPSRLMTLPLPTWSLAGWPMLWTTSVPALAWLTLSCGVLRMGGVELGFVTWWGALTLAVALAWLQAIVWLPFPLPGLRLFVIGPLLVAAVIGPQLLRAEFDPGTALGGAALAIQLPLAYLTAVYGVARARRGGGPTWAWPGWRTWLRWTSATTVDRPFVSPARRNSGSSGDARGISSPSSSPASPCPGC